MSLKLYEVNDLAKMLSISERQVWRLRGAGIIPAPVKVGRATRWRENDIVNWINKGCPDMRAGRKNRRKEDR